MVTVYNSHPVETVAGDELTVLVEQVLRGESAGDAIVSVILCDHGEHRKLHLKYLGHDYPTDVLAFSLGEGDQLEGEVYVDLDTARERHHEFESSFELEVARYVIHGTLHLLGFDDHDSDSRSRMKTREDHYVHAFATQQSQGRTEP